MELVGRDAQSVLEPVQLHGRTHQSEVRTENGTDFALQVDVCCVGTRVEREDLKRERESASQRVRESESQRQGDRETERQR